MSRHLTDADVVSVVNFLKSWTGQLTWDLLIERCERIRKIKPSRQALDRKKDIRDAFEAAKKRLKNPPSLSIPVNLEAAIERLSRLDADVESLKAENAKYKEKFVRWQYNAAMHGLREKDLENELPLVDRGQTLKAKRSGS